MNLKKLIIVSCILIAILSLSAVSAEDNALSTFSDDNDDAFNQLCEDEDTVQTSDDSQKTFDDLQKDIDAGQDNIVLNNNYTYLKNKDKTVLINKTITIDGNNHVINATGQSKIFNVTAENVTLKNIVFIYDDYEDFKASKAFYWTGSNGKLINSTFVFNRYSQTTGLFDELESKIDDADGLLVLDKDYIFLKKSIKHVTNEIFNDPSGISVIGGDAEPISSSDTDFEGIVIKKSITIDGQGHTLNGNAWSRIFKVDNGTVIFKNIVFYQGSSANGSAICGKSLAINCTFDSNWCRHVPIYMYNSGGISTQRYRNCYGGATYDVDVINCTFKNNGHTTTSLQFGTSHTYGPAMYGGSALNSNFIVDDADIIRNVNATNCTFSEKKIAGYKFDVSEFESVKYGDKLTVYLTGYGSSVNGEAIGVEVFKNNVLVGNYSCMSGYAWNIDLDAGNYTAILNMKGDSFKVSNVSVNFTVDKIASKISLTPVSAIYKDDKYLIITLSDGDNNPLAGYGVSVDLNGVKNLITDVNGQIKVSTKDLTPKTYTATATFSHSNFEKSSSSVNVVVKKSTPKLTASKKTFKVKAKSKKYTVTLKDNKNQALANIKVALKVKGKTYSAKTNNKGAATFKITKLTKKGSFKATVEFSGNSYYNKVAKTVKITVKK